MAKLPAFQFYPGDWMKDPALRSVSVAARGLWIDALCLMFESSRRGYLQHASGKSVTAEQLARMTGCSTDDVSRLLQELEDSGVFSRTEHGAIYSRRMVHDERVRQVNRENGRKGGNPNLVSDNRGVNRHPNRSANRKPTPSSSASTSSSPSGEDNPPNPQKGEVGISVEDLDFPEKLNTPEVHEAVKDWLEHKRTKGQRYKTAKTAASIFKVEAAAGGPKAFVAAINHSIGCNYAGIFPAGGRSGSGTVASGPGQRFDPATDTPEGGAITL